MMKMNKGGVMKVINSKKAINKILEDQKDAELYDFLEEDFCPCWEIKIDRDRGDLVFLIDSKENYAYPLKKIKEELTLDLINIYMQVFKTQDLKKLARTIKNGHKKTN